jgi:hypothetical protein
VRDIAYALRKLRKDVKELQNAHVDLFHQHVGLGVSHDDLEMNVGAIAGILDEHLEAEEIDGETGEAEIKAGDKVVLAYEDDELGAWEIPEEYFGQVAVVLGGIEPVEYDVKFEDGREFYVKHGMVDRAPPEGSEPIEPTFNVGDRVYLHKVDPQFGRYCIPVVAWLEFGYVVSGPDEYGDYSVLFDRVGKTFAVKPTMIDYAAEVEAE